MDYLTREQWHVFRNMLVWFIHLNTTGNGKHKMYIVSFVPYYITDEERTAITFRTTRKAFYKLAALIMLHGAYRRNSYHQARYHSSLSFCFNEKLSRALTATLSEIVNLQQDIVK